MAELFLAVLVSIGVLYAPGYFVHRGLALGRFASLALAPVSSCLLLACAGVVLGALGIRCDPAVMFAFCAALAVVFFAVCAMAFGGVLNRREIWPDSQFGAKRIWTLAALYIAVALFIVCIVFVANIDGPHSFSRNDDTAVHLSVTRAFLDTGSCSTLSVSSFLDLGLKGGFYPAEWHVAAAVVASCLGGDVSLAFNGTAIAFIAVVFPLIMLLFLRRFFSDERVALTGCLFPAAFSGFPWGFLVFGQLFPNMISFMFVPAALVLLQGVAEPRPASARVRLGVLLAISVGAIVLGQPNGAFTWGIWAVCFMVGGVLFGRRLRDTSFGRRAVYAAVIIAVACAGWAVLYHAPFLQGVIQTTWPAPLSRRAALTSGVLLMFSDRQGAQVLLALFVVFGFVRALRHPRHSWVALAYFVALAIYAVDASTDGMLKHLLSGFWYTDYTRTGAMVALFAMPLAAYGFAWAVQVCASLVERGIAGRIDRAAALPLSMGALTLILGVSLFTVPKLYLYSTYSLPVGLNKIEQQIKTRYSWDGGLTGDEVSFIQEVQAIVPEGSLIVNVPSDGSSWSYGVEGLSVLYRRSSDWGGTETSEESALIRTQLCDIESSPAVRDVVDRLGAKYVLILDDQSGDERTVSKLRYAPEKWRGIESITPETPGFKLLLSEGDMRLYEIEP